MAALLDLLAKVTVSRFKANLAILYPMNCSFLLPFEKTSHLSEASYLNRSSHVYRARRHVGTVSAATLEDMQKEVSNGHERTLRL